MFLMKNSKIFFQTFLQLIIFIKNIEIKKWFNKRGAYGILKLPAAAKRMEKLCKAVIKNILKHLKHKS